jgi:hypothetical protein
MITMTPPHTKSYLSFEVLDLVKGQLEGEAQYITEDRNARAG